MGEVEREEGPVDLPPAERACQGWQALASQAKRECEAQRGFPRAAKRSGAKRKQTKVRWTFVPLSGQTTKGLPWPFERSRTAQR